MCMGVCDVSLSVTFYAAVELLPGRALCVVCTSIGVHFMCSAVLHLLAVVLWYDACWRLRLFHNMISSCILQSSLVPACECLVPLAWGCLQTVDMSIEAPVEYMQLKLNKVCMAGRCCQGLLVTVLVLDGRCSCPGVCKDTDL